MREKIILPIALTVALASAFLYPGGNPVGEDIVTIRNVSSLLFGILAGFFVAFLLNRFATIRSLLTRESTMLMELYKIAQSFGQPFADRVADKIDAYLVIRFDKDNYFRFSTRGKDALFSIFDDLRALEELSSQNLVSMHRHFVGTLRETIPLRRETIVTGNITVSFVQWCSLLLLAFILVASLYCLKSSSFLSSLLTGLLAFAIFLMLYVVKDLSQLRLGGDYLKYETIERVFEHIGKLRYYPLSRIREGEIPSHVERLRLGIGANQNYSETIIEVSRQEAYDRSEESP
jgi:ABC-type multidrug transport system fused ATPase/permease subunit